MLSKTFCQECESIAVRVRHNVELRAYDALSAWQLASHMKVQLVEPQYLPDIDEGTLAKAIMSDRWSAIAIPASPPIIVYHPRRSLVQLECNIMHELAHIQLMHKPEHLGKISDRYITRSYPKQQEYEADYLADCLQITQVGLHYAVQHQMSVSEIALFFGVLPECVQRRIDQVKSLLLR